ncbi:AMP-binding protein [Halostreptopolyspora alba]
MSDHEEHDGVERVAADDGMVASRALCALLERTARSHGDTPALTVHGADGRRSGLTWAETRTETLRTAAGLRGLGVRRGDRVALISTPRPEYAVGYLGTIHLGARPVSVHDSLPAEQVTYAGVDSGAVVAIVEEGVELRRWIQALPELGSLLALVVIDQSTPRPRSVMSWNELVAAGADQSTADPRETRQRPEPPCSDEDTALVYVPDATGRPTGVARSHPEVLRSSGLDIDPTSRVAAAHGTHR